MATAQAPLNAVHVADDKEGTVVSGPGCREEVKKIMGGEGEQRYAFEAAVRALMARESGGEAEEQEAVTPTEEELKEWADRKITFKRFQASLARSKAMKGCGHDGWNDYLLRKAPEEVQGMYYDVVKMMIQEKAFPSGWKGWTATFAMKPREDPRKLGRRRDYGAPVQDRS